MTRKAKPGVTFHATGGHPIPAGWKMLVIVLSLVAVSCGKKDQGGTDLVTFPLRGEVVAVDSVRRIVTIAHQEIPGYMDAMTMPFKIKNPALLNRVAVGDSVVATLAVSRFESWLETLAVVGTGTVPRTLAPDDILRSRLFRTGAPLPDETLLNQDGRTVHLSDFHGKVLALTFIYTRCPLPDYCIRMTSSFAAIQSVLQGDAGLEGKWHLLSISFDPVFDRPAVLKEYARRYHAGQQGWDFVTDPDTTGPAVHRLADGLGLSSAEEEGLIAHNLRTALIDSEGKLVKVIDGNDWRPEEVLAEMRKLATR